MPDLNMRFAEAEGAPIRVGKDLVQMSYWLGPIWEPSVLGVEIEPAADSSRAQGARLDAEWGRMTVNGHEVTKTVLWSDTAPRVVEIDLQPTSKRKPIKPMRVQVVNAWRPFIDPTENLAEKYIGDPPSDWWLGNHGIVVSELSEGAVELRCSDGVGEPNFNDLVLRLRLSPATED